MTPVEANTIIDRIPDVVSFPTDHIVTSGYSIHNSSKHDFFVGDHDHLIYVEPCRFHAAGHAQRLIWQELGCQDTPGSIDLFFCEAQCQCFIVPAVHIIPHEDEPLFPHLARAGCKETISAFLALDLSITAVFDDCSSEHPEGFSRFVVYLAGKLWVQLDISGINAAQHEGHHSVVVPGTYSNPVGVVSCFDLQPAGEFRFREAEGSGILADLLHGNGIRVENVCGFIGNSSTEFV